MKQQSKTQKTQSPRDVVKESNRRLVISTLLIVLIVTITSSIAFSIARFNPFAKIAEYISSFSTETTETTSVSIEEIITNNPDGSFEQRITDLLHDLTSSGRLERAYIGIKYVTIAEEEIPVHNLPSDVSGAYIGEVLPNSPAQKAKLKAGDIITHIDGERVTADNPLNYIIAKHNVGDSINVTYLRDNEARVVKITLTELQN